MNTAERNYIALVLAHVALGTAIFALPFLSKVYAVLILIVGFYFVAKNRNRSHEALYVAGYIIGAEVLLRMTGANLLYEYGKYSVVLFIMFGTYYSGFSKNGAPYWLFLLLLIPGIVIATQTLGPGVEMRKTISFNISGPFCLGIAALYCYRRPITISQLYDILLCIGLPIVSIMTYLIFFTPDLRESVTGTGSNFATSGGFGPNQVSTILGLGMFIFFSRVLLCSPGKIIMAVNLILALNLSYRGLITFSRGGMITGLVMLCVLMGLVYLKINSSGRSKMHIAFIGALVVFFGIWTYSSFMTGGLIEKRYANQDAAGRTKTSQFSGREQIASDELEHFLENPVFGIGVAKGAEIRIDSGGDTLSHNEITRLLAEHGSLGIMALVILITTPLLLYIDNKNHIMLISFVIFWLLTINHAAMRTASPAFIYALSLLKISYNDKRSPAVHRE
ncbi:O-antigen ligase family protein [Flavobacterium selenitireducens]|uniref:O-antigen ligase family protein n=1 Tax=Flavobacterium selenitireducens TaxID=2722704 RepID=UPI00168AA23D|nr:O-antigen ligase family protein [Flavobacterium selenitireducens]MBD3583425.1 O-antigen ligase family protein [Flavobacterium selenitireducens]